MRAFFMFFISLQNIVLEEEISFAWDIKLLIITFYIQRGIHF